MPLDFPNSPTNGQIYENYYYDAANSVWQTLGSKLETTANISNTPTGTYTSGGVSYKYVSFTSSGTLTVTRGGLCDVLLVGGGGAGATAGAGGGAGGHLYVENAYLPAGSLSVVVGAGGASFASPADFYTIGGNNGIASQIGSFYIAPGGGGGAPRNYRYNGTDEGFGAGKNGGSGGGAAAGVVAQGSNTAGLGISGLGNNGGIGALNYGAGGGGGAGAGGSNGTNTAGGNGGAGLANSITGTSVTRAGGGGGSGNLTGSSGGSGGGGAGTGAAGDGGAGTANTGGGGGGCHSSAGGRSGGAGGSGIVIVRWVA
jgi:hypothetical protein